MARPRKSVPSYRLHRSSGQAIVTLTDGLGHRRDVLLGKYGSKESKSAYARIVAEWESSGQRLPTATSGGGITVNEALMAYLKHAEWYYRHPDSSPTSQLDRVQRSIKPVRELYGLTPAKDFGPLALKTVRERLIEAKLARRHINCLIGCVKRAFKWMVANQLVPAHVYHGLQAVEGLKRGRSDAKETAPVKPVAPGIVEDTLRVMHPTVADMLRLLRLSGMRSGELTIMRGCDLDVSGKV